MESKVTERDKEEYSRNKYNSISDNKLKQQKQFSGAAVSYQTLLGNEVGLSYSSLVQAYIGIIMRVVAQWSKDHCTFDDSIIALCLYTVSLCL